MQTTTGRPVASGGTIVAHRCQFAETFTEVSGFRIGKCLRQRFVFINCPTPIPLRRLNVLEERMRDGRQIAVGHTHIKGEAELPLTRAERAEKLVNCAGHARYPPDTDAADYLLWRLERLEELENLRPLSARL